MLNIYGGHFIDKICNFSLGNIAVKVTNKMEQIEMILWYVIAIYWKIFKKHW